MPRPSLYSAKEGFVFLSKNPEILTTKLTYRKLDASALIVDIWGRNGPFSPTHTRKANALLTVGSWCENQYLLEPRARWGLGANLARSVSGMENARFAFSLDKFA